LYGEAQNPCYKGGSRLMYPLGLLNDIEGKKSYYVNSSTFFNAQEKIRVKVLIWD
jgi:hypothetical protein